MIYKFICRFHYPVRAEIYMSAADEETAKKDFIQARNPDLINSAID